MNLFRREEFIGAGGMPLTWKIECDALTVLDWETIAFAVADKMPPFGNIRSIPRGGTPLAQAMIPYIDANSRDMLIVDDVWTTGKSMLSMRNHIVDTGFYNEIFGLVAFARTATPLWVTAFARLGV